jgi:hypothetical protein
VIIRCNGESGALRMAQAIARRHARIGDIARSVPFVLRKLRPFRVNHFHVVRPCSFVPRLSFHLTSNRSTERVEKFVGGIRERFVRVPAASAESGGRPSASGPPPRMRAGATLAKPAVAVPAAHALPADTSATSIAIPATRTAAALTPTTDVNRLANEVLQVIDKRIIAYRERAGRR